MFELKILKGMKQVGRRALHLVYLPAFGGSEGNLNCSHAIRSSFFSLRMLWAMASSSVISVFR